MSILNIPEAFVKKESDKLDLFVYDFKMTDDVVKSKVNLTLNMFSFLQTGQKQVQFANASVAVNQKQSLLIKSGNCLMTELLDNDDIYFCKLFFFSQKNVENFIIKHHDFLCSINKKGHGDVSFFVIENDEYIKSFVASISTIMKIKPKLATHLLVVKFEEIMLYLVMKYGVKFIDYIHSLISEKSNSSFRKIIENNVNTALKLEEIAFLCNMSLSTFKRHFIEEYQSNPGKWFQQKRLTKAKEILQKGKLTASEIFTDFGYNNLSNFSAAFKNEFGFSPNKLDLIS